MGVTAQDLSWVRRSFHSRIVPDILPYNVLGFRNWNSRNQYLHREKYKDHTGADGAVALLAEAGIVHRSSGAGTGSRNHGYPAERHTDSLAGEIHSGCPAEKSNSGEAGSD